MVKSYETEQLRGGFWLDDWLVQPLQNRISRGHVRRTLEPKVMDVLVCMARRGAVTVTKEQFMDEVWGGTVVTDDVLSRCISELRKAFEDDSRDPHVIETIRKTGYRLIAPVVLAESEPGAGRREAPVPHERERSLATPRWRQRLKGLSSRVEQILARPVVMVSILGLIAVVILATLLSERVSRVPVDPPKPIPFTSFPGLELDAALSPDGRRVAFAWDNGTGRDFDLYVKQSGGETPLRLTDDPDDERHPAWSSDGLSLAFVRSSEQKDVIFSIPSIGGTPRKIADLGGRRVRDLAWAPDGKAIAVAVQSSPYGVSSIFLLAPDSSSLERLTFPPEFFVGGRSVSFSRDGRRLAFVRAVTEEIQDVFVVSMDGSEPRQISFDSTVVAGIDWTADGKGIVFASLRSGISALWRMPASGGEPVWIVSAAGDSGLEHPSVSADGRRLTYVERTSDSNIWRLWRDDRNAPFKAHPLVFSTRWDSNPSISPDGERIVYASDQSGHREVWICDRSGANQSQLTDSEDAWSGAPRWSPDGTEIAVVTRRRGQAEIRIVSPTGLLLKVVPSATDDAIPSWSRDGSYVYYSSAVTGRPEIWRAPKDSGGAEQVTFGGGRSAIESPDRDYLYVVRPDTSGIWRIPLSHADSTAARGDLVIPSLDPRDTGNWVVTDRGIYFLVRRKWNPAVMFYSFETRLTSTVATLRNVPEEASLAVSPDASWLLYTQVDDREGDVMLIQHFR